MDIYVSNYDVCLPVQVKYFWKKGQRKIVYYGKIKHLIRILAANIWLSWKIYSYSNWASLGT